MGKIEYSETQLKIWGLMLKSKESAQPAANMWDGLCRVNQLASDYVKEIYGDAALFYNGKYYTPDCILIPEETETAAQKRARIRGDAMPSANKEDALRAIEEET